MTRTQETDSLVREADGAEVTEGRAGPEEVAKAIYPSAAAPSITPALRRQTDPLVTDRQRT